MRVRAEILLNALVLAPFATCARQDTRDPWRSCDSDAGRDVIYVPNGDLARDSFRRSEETAKYCPLRQELIDKLDRTFAERETIIVETVNPWRGGCDFVCLVKKSPDEYIMLTDLDKDGTPFGSIREEQISSQSFGEIWNRLHSISPPQAAFDGRQYVQAVIDGSDYSFSWRSGKAWRKLWVAPNFMKRGQRSTTGQIEYDHLIGIANDTWQKALAQASTPKL